MYTCPSNIAGRMNLHKKVSIRVLMCAPSISASVIMMIFEYLNFEVGADLRFTLFCASAAVVLGPRASATSLLRASVATFVAPAGALALVGLSGIKMLGSTQIQLHLHACTCMYTHNCSGPMSLCMWVSVPVYMHAHAQSGINESAWCLCMRTKG